MSSDHEGPEPDVEAAALIVAPESDGGRCSIGTVDALTEAAGWAQRWAAERQRADAIAAELARIDALHVPYVDEDGRTRCRGCIAGYDRATGHLVHCAYPCPTIQARRGELPL